MPMLTSPHGENPIGPLSRAPRPASRTTRSEADSSMGNDVSARWPPYAPFCSDGIGLSVLPGASRLLGLAPVGCRRLTRSRVNVTVGRIILDAGCVVSAPLPALSGPPLARGHHSEGGGTFLSDPERPPSAVRGLLAGRTKCRALFGPAAVPAGPRRLAECKRLFAAGRRHRPKEDPMRAGREEYGIRILFVALVLALVNGIVWFPVWSSGPEGTGMRILLGFVTIQPLAFILERLLPSVAIVGVLGAYLVEIGRHETRGGRGGWWDRARFAFVSAI